jgi:hypothetical protein
MVDRERNVRKTSRRRQVVRTEGGFIWLRIPLNGANFGVCSIEFSGYNIRHLVTSLIFKLFLPRLETRYNGLG